MNKTQYLEKCREELRRNFYGKILGAIVYPEQQTFEELQSFLQSKLSECWDMAEEEILETIEKDKKIVTTLPDPIEAIKFRMEQYGHNQTKTSEITGIPENHLSEILNKRRRLSKNHMIAFMNYGVPSKVLLQHYSLTSKQEEEKGD